MDSFTINIPTGTESELITDVFDFVGLCALDLTLGDGSIGMSHTISIYTSDEATVEATTYAYPLKPAFLWETRQKGEATSMSSAHHFFRNRRRRGGQAAFFSNEEI